MNHRLTLVDRGPEHRHRYWATCACGWDSVPCRRRREAERRYRLHVSQQSDGKRARGRLLSRMRRAPTPHRQLPDELRAVSWQEQAWAYGQRPFTTRDALLALRMLGYQPRCVCSVSFWCPLHGWNAAPC